MFDHVDCKTGYAFLCFLLTVCVTVHHWTRVCLCLRTTRGRVGSDLTGCKTWWATDRENDQAGQRWSEGFKASSVPGGQTNTNIYTLTGGLCWYRSFVLQGLVPSPCWLKRHPYSVVQGWHVARNRPTIYLSAFSRNITLLLLHYLFVYNIIVAWNNDLIYSRCHSVAPQPK